MSEQRTDRRRHSWLALLVLGAAACTAALAQQSPAPIPPPERLEPGVDTSAIGNDEKRAPATNAPAANAPAANAPAASAPAGTHASSAATTAASSPAPSGPAAAAPGAPRGNAAATPAAATRAKKGPDRLELEATDITGNRELPKVLYIVPWKRADLGDLVGKPTNSLLDEVLQPLDRDVFQRENRYYDALKTDAAPAPAAPLSGAKP